MESLKRAAKRAADLLDAEEMSGWRLAQLTAERTLTSENRRIVKEERAEGRVSSTEWAEAVSKARGRPWSATTARQYATAWRRYGAERLVTTDGGERPFFEHLSAANVAEENIEKELTRSRKGAPTPAEVVKAVRENPDVARAIARHDDTREAVEEYAIEARSEKARDITKADRSTRQRIDEATAAMSRRLGTDEALIELRTAAGALAEAIRLKEQHGVEHVDQEAELLDRIDRYRAAYATNGHLTDDDFGWLAAQGIEP